MFKRPKQYEHIKKKFKKKRENKKIKAIAIFNWKKNTLNEIDC